jgi:phosphoribosylformylglycinamidine synthase
MISVFDISLDENIRSDAFLFGESQSRVIISVSPDRQDEFIDRLVKEEVEFSLLGEVTDSRILVDSEDWDGIAEWKQIFENAIASEMNHEQVEPVGGS